MKIAAPKATLDDLKHYPRDGIANINYDVTVEMPKRFVHLPQAGVGISTIAAQNERLAELMLGVSHTEVSKVGQDTVLLTFTVAQPYLPIFKQDLSRLEGAEIIIGDEGDE